MRKICFITGSRADYGIMSGLMHRVKDSPEAEIQIVATNMHLSEHHGLTVNEIIKDGFKVNWRVDSDLKGDSADDTIRSMGATMAGMASAFKELKPDIAVILGDRYEMLATASAANIMNIPVAHLHGGEVTEGAYDDSMRHAITKLSYYHFAATEESAKRIIQMGESPENVFNYGSLGVENIFSTELFSLEELEKELKFDFSGRYFVVAFHPETRQPGEEMIQTQSFIKSIEYYINKGWKFIVTLPNSDTGNLSIAALFKDLALKHPENVYATPSLGKKKFFSSLAYSSGIIGNSSSGLIEAPSFHIPTINVGDRQKGRLRGPSVIDSECDTTSIIKAIGKGLSAEFNREIKELSQEELNPYYKKNVAENICNKLIKGNLSAIKKFYDL